MVEKLESWRFDPVEWTVKIQGMGDAELKILFSHHLNYIPNSPVTHLAQRELARRSRAA